MYDASINVVFKVLTFFSSRLCCPYHIIKYERLFVWVVNYLADLSASSPNNCLPIADTRSPTIPNYAVDCVSGAFLMVSRAVYERVGGLDEDYFMYGEDIDWCYRIRAGGYRVWYEGSSVTVHHKGGNGGKRSAHSLYHFYNTMLIYYRKHHAARYPTWLTALLSLVMKCLYACHLTVARIRGRLKP